MSEIIRVPTPDDIIADQFVLRRELGRGGYGVVFEATQLGIDRKVAVKMLLPRAIEAQASVIERFQREARLASSLTHPSAVTIYAFGVHEGATEEVELPYLVMEYLDGEDLGQFLDRKGTLPPEEVAFILEQVLGSLGEAHRKGIIHRDIKPDNIFLHQPPGEDLQIKVLDYGIAMAYTPEWSPHERERLTKTGMVTGTAEYIAPEMISGERVLTPAVDVYSLACVAYHMLTGTYPYDGANPIEIAIKHLHEPIPELPEAIENTFLGQMLYKALSKAPTDRYQDAAHFAKALRTGELSPEPDHIPTRVGTERQIVVPQATGSLVAVAAMADAPHVASGHIKAHTRPSHETTLTPTPSQGIPAWIWWGGAAAVILVLAGVVLMASNQTSPTGPTGPVNNAAATITAPSNSTKKTKPAPGVKTASPSTPTVTTKDAPSVDPVPGKIKTPTLKTEIKEPETPQEPAPEKTANKRPKKKNPRITSRTKPTTKDVEPSTDNPEAIDTQVDKTDLNPDDKTPAAATTPDTGDDKNAVDPKPAQEPKTPEATEEKPPQQPAAKPVEPKEPTTKAPVAQEDKNKPTPAKPEIKTKPKEEPEVPHGF